MSLAPYGSEEPPLCVDLDGTLVRTDTLLETAALFARTHPTHAWRLPSWLFRGRAYFKHRLASQTAIDPSTLPYNEELLERLRGERARGRRLVLVTAADASIAERVAGYLGIFTDVIASDGESNLKGERKRDKLVELFGEKKFDYAGDARSDLPVWNASRTPILVNAARSVTEAAPPEADRSLAARPSVWLALLRALRPHQWLKNILIFIPLLMSHRILDGSAFALDVVAFVAFSLCASGIYLVNDFFDLPSDRRHRTKRYRPLASGTLPLGLALATASLLIVAALAIAAALSAQFVLVIVGYLALTLAYSLALKRVVMLDVVLLAMLYASRLLAGSVAASVGISFWLLAFALFMFLSLAMLKRYSELLGLRAGPIASVNGRDYMTTDTEMIAMFGVASGYVAVLVVALYIHGDLVRSLYAHPDLLWGICPVLLYWVSRTWLTAQRGAVNDDPILFAIQDRTSIVVAALCLAIGLLATLKLEVPFG